MDEERDSDVTLTQPEPAPAFSLRNLDEETIQILVEDKIATGG